MGRIYTVEFENVTIASADGDLDFFEVTPADDKPVKLVGLFLSQMSDVGDAAEEILRFRIIRGHATSGSGAPAAVTPRPVNPFDAAAGFTAEICNDVIASTGTPLNLHSEAFNIRVGYQNWWPEDAAPMASQADTTIVVRLMAGPADDVTMSGTLYVKEV